RQRVEEKTLVGGPRAGQRGTHQDGEQNARQPELEQDRALHGGLGARQDRQGAAERDLGAPGEQAGGAHGEEERQERQQEARESPAAHRRSPGRPGNSSGWSERASNSRTSAIRGPGRETRSPSRMTIRPRLTASTPARSGRSARFCRLTRLAWWSGARITSGLRSRSASELTSMYRPESSPKTLTPPASSMSCPMSVLRVAVISGRSQTS